MKGSMVGNVSCAWQGRRRAFVHAVTGLIILKEKAMQA
jgi:hypothetical protein